MWKFVDGVLGQFDLVETRIQRTEDDNTPIEAEIATHCEVCLGSDHDDQMMLCDGCDKGYHTLCVGLVCVPDLEEWFCQTCLLSQSLYIQRMQARETAKVASIPQAGREEKLKRKRLRRKEEEEDSQEGDELVILVQIAVFCPTFTTFISSIKPAIPLVNLLLF